MIGRLLNGRYEIIELIGRGGMAYVYKAKDLKLNRFVAVKVLRDEYTENEQFIKKFDRESQAAAGLTHPNIVSVYDVGVDDDVYFIIMEYVDGITLKQYLDKKGVLDYEEATNFIIDVAEALKCAHEHKIIHRDIKPHNILLTRDLVPKVTDFGIARAVTSSTVTMTNQTMGSVHYISPEQARGGFVDERSDLYSLGIMYYELVTGELPFDEESTVTIAIKHIREEIVPPKEINPNIPDSVNAVILKLTQKKPEERYQNVDELVADLDRLMMDAEAAVGMASGMRASNTDELFNDLGDDGLFKVEPATMAQPIIPDDDEVDETGLSDLQSRKKKKKMIIVGVIAAVIVLILAIVAINAFSPKKNVTVPDVTNMTKEQATTALNNLKLTLEVEKEVYSSTVDAGKIVSQNPTAGSTSQEGKTIKVSISKGSQSVGVPSVIGLSENDAITAIEGAKLAVGEIQREFNSDYSTGTVFKVSPGEGSQVAEKSKVTLYVSKGPDVVNVPGIVGLAKSDADSRIQANGLSVGTVTEEHSSTYATGVVIRQSPSEGTQTERGSAVNYVVSSGPEPTPTATPAPTTTVKPAPTPDN
ncbi:MAG: Stk1 family PASTA domain-containing Ser/Thr kinase [Eubacterium aggregans]|uniref:non-specific serine/threonine protein kinase n=1 Tax=Eubacterium aggregans TaxID=81409 RepID=A0A1H4CW00_9FIRM|nr:Stk1 family PASTA domain-containing Ser/Thr kinase [Eubacterium aggregans]MEA5074098.1 Stk1 family PASTA domain-containing Ser/Thr kinase [Eubacterium aggregans]SEA64282.1 serine/threonine protein kinase [Eubacterium aggregans]